MGSSGPPIDRGWAWVIAAGLFLKSFVTGGFIKSYGVFFSAFSETFERPASETQFVKSARAISSTIVGPISTVLSERLTERTVVMTGALFLSAAFIMAFFAESLEFLIFTFGIFSGVGMALVNGPSKVCLGRYFDKKRGRANSLALVGAAIGQIAVPPLVAALLSEYTLRGAMLIYGGLALNVVITGALMRPLSSYKTKDNQPLKQQETNEAGCERRGDNSVHEADSDSDSGINGDLQREDLPERDTLVTIDAAKKLATLETQVSADLSLDKIPFHVESHLFENSRHSHHNGSMRSIVERIKEVGSNLTVNTAADEEPIDLQKIPPKNSEDEKRSICFMIIKFFKTVFDRKVLTNPLYILFLFCTAMFMAANANQLTFIVPRAQQIGISRDMAAVLLSIVGGCDVFGRLLLGVLADVKFLSSHQVMAVGVLITSLSMFAIPSTQTFGQMVGVSVIFGIFGSSHAILNLPVMVDFVGKDFLAKAVGMSMLFYGISSAIFAPLLGFVKDSSGSYDTVFYVTASMQVFASLLMIFLVPLAKRKVRRDPDSKQRDDISVEIEADVESKKT